MCLLQQFLNLIQFTNLRYHFTPFQVDVAYDFSLLYDKIAKGFSISLRDQRCLTLKVLSTVDIC